MARIFLHFINRELHQSLGAKPSVDTYMFVVRLCTVLFSEQLVCNISQIYELLYGAPEATNELVELSKFDILQFDASHPSFDEFFEQRREYYEHDLQRYPMYTNAAASEIFSRARITQFESVHSTTRHIQRELLEVAIAADTPPDGVRVAEAMVLKPIAAPLQRALQDRENRGLTFALFPARNVKFDSLKQQFVLRRVLSGAYVTHYIQELDACIITGIPTLPYYDSRSKDPRVGTDFRFMARIFSLLGLSAYLKNFPSHGLTPRIEGWLSAEHQLFAERYSQLAAGLDWAFRSQKGPSNGGARWAVAQCARIFDQRSHSSTTTLKDVYLRCVASINSASEILQRELPGFEEGWKLTSLPTNLRVLITTATDLEDKKFDEMVLREGLKLIGEDRGGSETVREYFGVSGVSLFQVRSSAGSTGPSGAHLAAFDAIQRKNPDFIICCGICFGMNRKKQRLGDVVVSEQVAFYEPGRVQEKAGAPPFVPRGGKVYAGSRLIDKARQAKRDWSASGCHPGLIASGDKLVDSAAFKAYLSSIAPEAIAGEMESAGVFSAAIRKNKEAIVIKGICDWGEAKDKKEQARAAENAFAFAMALIRKL